MLQALLRNIIRSKPNEILLVLFAEVSKEIVSLIWEYIVDFLPSDRTGSVLRWEILSDILVVDTGLQFCDAAFYFIQQPLGQF